MQRTDTNSDSYPISAIINWSGLSKRWSVSDISLHLLNSCVLIPFTSAFLLVVKVLAWVSQATYFLLIIFSKFSIVWTSASLCHDLVSTSTKIHFSLLDFYILVRIQTITLLSCHPFLISFYDYLVNIFSCIQSDYYDLRIRLVIHLTHQYYIIKFLSVSICPLFLGRF